MASRNLNDLSDECRKKAIALEATCLSGGIELLIYCTYRSPEEQDELYACGRTKEGKIVTNCRGGMSKHNRQLPNGRPASDAFDCVPLINGKAQWNDKLLYAKIGELGEKAGLKWAGKWVGRLKETAHFEV